VACCQPLLRKRHHVLIAQLAAAAAAARALAAGGEGDGLVLAPLAAARVVPLEPAAAHDMTRAHRRSNKKYNVRSKRTACCDTRE
jgi:hypothetical protein